MSTWLSPTDHWDVRCDDCGDLAGTRAETENAPLLAVEHVNVWRR